MTAKLRIAHCSDIHLDGDVHSYGAAGMNWSGNGGGEFHRRAFATALEEIAAHAPDMMLLPGDLFDTNRARADTIQWAMEILGRQPFPIIMIPGNHDCMEEGAIYRRHDFNRVDNVTMLCAEAGEMAHLPELGVAVWGKGMVEHTPRYSPLAGCPDRPADCRWYLGMGHGLFVPHRGETGRSSQIHMREIEASPCDYLALGHHHAAMELMSAQSAAAYSGSPTDTVGRGPTYVMVELTEGAPAALEVHPVRNFG